jgi:hypothetical protein
MQMEGGGRDLMVKSEGQLRTTLPGERPNLRNGFKITITRK